MPSLESKQINPWKNIWTQPKATMRHLLETDPYRMIWWLAILGGILGLLTWDTNFWLMHPHDEANHRPAYLLFALLAGAALGIINLYFGGWLYRWIGSWLKGTGNFTELKCAIGWGYYPFIVAEICLLLAQLLIHHPILSFILKVMNFVLLIWSVVISSHLIGEAHRFSAWKGFATILIAGALLFLLFIVLFLVITPLRTSMIG